MITNCGYFYSHAAITIPAMQTIGQTRVSRLRLLVQRHGGVPALADRLLGKPSEAQIRQILSEQVRSETGGVYKMGDNLARRIESTLNLERGWMDTPPTYAELSGEDDPQAKVMMRMEQMSPDMQRLLLSLAIRWLNSPLFRRQFKFPTAPQPRRPAAKIYRLSTHQESPKMNGKKKLFAAHEQLLTAQAKLDAALLAYSEELAKRQGMTQNSDFDAIHLHLIEKHHWTLPHVRSLSAADLRLILSQELKGWTIPGDWL